MPNPCVVRLELTPHMVYDHLHFTSFCKRPASEDPPVGLSLGGESWGALQEGSPTGFTLALSSDKLRFGRPFMSFGSFFYLGFQGSFSGVLWLPPGSPVEDTSGSVSENLPPLCS